MSVPDGWEAVIGLEIHVQLSTRSKMFCRCPNESGGEPNTRICPVCTAQPGALPVANRAAVERTIAVGLALGSEIAAHSTFHRKNYFYPDSPKAYQISQYDEPLCSGGQLAVPTAERRRRRGLRARAPRGGRGQDHPRGRGRRTAGRLARRRRRLQPLRHAAHGDGHEARPALARAGLALRLVPARDDRGARRLGVRHGEGLAARRRQRQPAPSRRGRAAHQDRAQEHELVQLPRARHRARAAAPGRAVRGGRGVLDADAALRPVLGRAHRAALQGARARLPLLPRAGPRADRALGGAHRRAAREPAGAAGGARAALRARVRAAARAGARPRHRQRLGGVLRGGRGGLRRRARRGQLGAQRVLGAPQRGAPEPPPSRPCARRRWRR